MNKFLRNRFMHAFLQLVLLSAVTHIAILIYQAIRTGTLTPLNYFRMLDITYFIPGLDGGLGADLASGAFALFIYFILFAFVSAPRNEEKTPPRE